MTHSLQITSQAYPGFGRCIFCLEKFASGELTDEHIVPFALSGDGEMILRKGSCRPCNNHANEYFEQEAFRKDFIVPRILLDLRRSKNSKSNRPGLPPIALDPLPGLISGAGGQGFDTFVEPIDYPPISAYARTPPAGLLVNEDRSDGMDALSFEILQFPIGSRLVGRFATRTPIRPGNIELVAAKMAFCFTVARHGLDALDVSDLRSLIRGERKDVFNFVGAPLVGEKLSDKYLHRFYFRRREVWQTVIVHFLASFGGPQYEVVVGRWR